jgi:multicomponent Na+:H+ antiporter subunit B
VKGPDSIIFRTVVGLSFYIINVAAIYLLLRGHNYPGGGFIGGLASAISFILLSLSIGMSELHKIVRVDPVRVAASGLVLAIVSSTAPLFAGRPFLEQFNVHFTLGYYGSQVHTGTPLLFDIGVFFVVVGVTCKIIFVLAKSTQGLRAMVAEDESRYSSPREEPIEDDSPQPQPTEKWNAN